MALSAATAMSRIAIAKEVEQARRPQWRRYMSKILNYSDQLDTDGLPPPAALSPNYAHDTVERLIPSIHYKSPRIYAIPDAPGYADRAEVVSALLTKKWRPEGLNMPRQVKKAIASALIFPFSVIKTGIFYQELPEIQRANDEHERELAFRENQQMIATGVTVAIDENDDHSLHYEVHNFILSRPDLIRVDAFYGATLDQAIGSIAEHAALHKEAIEHADRKLNLLEGWYDNRYRENSVFGIWVPSKDIFWLPDVDTIDETRYIIHRFIRILDDVKDSEIYEGTGDLTPTHFALAENRTLVKTGESEGILPSEDPEIQRIEMFEIWDIKEYELSTWVEQKRDRPLRRIAWPHQHIDWFPFQFLSYTEYIPEVVFGPSMLEYMQSKQVVENRLFEALRNIAESSNPKLYYEKTDESDEFFTAHKDPAMRLVPISNMNKKPLWGEPPPFQPALLTAIQLIEQSIYQDTKVSTAQRGGITGATATETSIAASAVNIVLDSQVEETRAFQSRIARDFLGILKQYGPPEELVRLTEGRQDEWAKFVRDDLNVTYTINVEFERPEDERVRRVMADNLYHLHSVNPHIDLKELTKWHLEQHDMSPERFLISESIDILQAIEQEHLLFSLVARGLPIPPPQPVEGQTHSLHMRGHERRMGELQQAAASDPVAAKEAQVLQQHMTDTDAVSRAESQPHRRSRRRTASRQQDNGQLETQLSKAFMGG